MQLRVHTKWQKSFIEFCYICFNIVSKFYSISCANKCGFIDQRPTIKRFSKTDEELSALSYTSNLILIIKCYIFFWFTTCFDSKKVFLKRFNNYHHLIPRLIGILEKEMHVAWNVNKILCTILFGGNPQIFGNYIYAQIIQENEQEMI